MNQFEAILLDNKFEIYKKGFRYTRFSGATTTKVVVAINLKI